MYCGEKKLVERPPEEILLRANEAETKQNLNYVGRCEVFLGFEDGGNDGMTSSKEFHSHSSHMVYDYMVYLPTFGCFFMVNVCKYGPTWDAMGMLTLGFRSPTYTIYRRI